MASRDIAEAGTILLSTVGSEAHGLSLPGTEDHDEMGVCIEPPEYVIGLQHFEQDVYRSKPQGVRSEHGDTDRTVYSARKFCRLALGGNPSILVLFYTKPTVVTVLGQQLLDLAPAFSARRAGKAFLGYETQQRQRLLGERGQMNVKRPELVDAYGYDVKYAYQMLRLGFQGIEFLETGRLTLPMEGDERTLLYQVRTGNVNLNEVLTRAGENEKRLEDLLETSPLAPEPAYSTVNEWLVSAYLTAWEER